MKGSIKMIKKKKNCNQKKKMIKKMIQKIIKMLKSIKCIVLLFN